MTNVRLVTGLVLSFLPLTVAPAAAQSTAAAPPVAIRGAIDVGVQHFFASQTFRGIFGGANHPVYGGGADVVLRHVFVRVDVTRFSKTGERAFDLNGQVFPLGIPLKVSVTPVIVTAGVRGFFTPRLAGYAGGGAGSWSYSEQSDDPTEDVSFRKTGYVALAGVEWRVHRWMGLGMEGQYARVPNALGGGGLSADLNETDLGGASAVVRVIVGR